MPFDATDPDTKAAIAAMISEATEGLVTKNRELLGKVATLRKGAEIDPATVTALEATVEELTGKLTAAEKATKDATKAREAAEAKATGESTYVQRLLVDNGLTSELVKAGVTPALMPAVKALLAGQVQVKVDGDSRKAVVGDKDLSAFVTEWATGPEGKHFVAAPANSGGGATGGKEGSGAINPFAKATFNLTEQGKIFTDNPQLAAQLQASAAAP